MTLVYLLLLILFINSNNINRSLLLIVGLLIILKKHKIAEKFFNFDNLIENKEVNKIMKSCCTNNEILLIKKKIKCMIRHPQTPEVILNNLNSIIPSDTNMLNKILTNL